MEILEVVILTVTITALVCWLIFREREPKSNEAEFLEILVDHYNYWKGKGEEEYAEVYKVLLNKFTSLEEKETDQ